jgi:hypothetical protein
LGEEVLRGTVAVKNLAARTQEEVALADAAATIARSVGALRPT